MATGRRNFWRTTVLLAAGSYSVSPSLSASETAPRGLRPAAMLASADPVIAAAGDIACQPGQAVTLRTCKHGPVSDLLLAPDIDKVLPLGDLQYENGELANFQGSYDPTWGRVKPLTSPAVGNHEYNTAGASGYFDYFNGPGNPTGPAGDRTKGYYSFDIGNWHLVVLNSNCSVLGQSGCGVGSAQEQWLRADLTAHPRSCQIAYMHHPRWASDNDNVDRSRPALGPLFQALYDHGVELLLTGHSHFYERFTPQDPNQQIDLAGGIRQFVVGTGGRSTETLGATQMNSEIRNDQTFGVLKLTLHPTSYDWEFVSIAGETFTDTGTEACHRLVPDTTPPSAPTVDTTPPSTPTLGGGTTFQTKRTFQVTWGDSADAETGVASYSISVRGAALNKAFQPPVQFKTGVPPGSAMFTGVPGSTYCFRATAADWVGNVSAGTEHCTAIPVDNGSLRHRGGWTKKRGAGHFLESYSQTDRRDATLTLRVVRAKHLAVLVTRCPKCGVIDVLFRGKKLKRIRLRSPTTNKLSMVALKTFDSPQTGTVTVRVVSDGKIVRVEGLGVRPL
jgi:acid phosphatase type 7